MPITLNKISFELDLTEKLKEIPRGKKREAKAAAAAELKEALLQDVSNSKSPVNGARFKGLSKDYRAIKKKKGKGGTPNLKLQGDMLAGLRVTPSTNGVLTKIVGSTQKKKSFNHNTGDTLPQRKHIPNDESGESFRRTILKRVNDVLDKFIRNGDG